MGSIVKIKINPITVDGYSGDKRIKSNVELPTQREMSFYLQTDLKNIGEWFKEGGSDCIYLRNVYIDDIQKMGMDSHFFEGQRLHVYCFFPQKIGYCQVVGSGSDTGWFVHRNFENWDRLNQEISFSNNLRTELDDKDYSFSFNVNYDSVQNEFVHKKTVQSVRELRVSDLVSMTNPEIFRDNTSYRYERSQTQNFKFFVNSGNYKNSYLKSSIKEVMKLNSRVTDQMEKNKTGEEGNIYFRPLDHCDLSELEVSK